MSDVNIEYIKRVAQQLELKEPYVLQVVTLLMEQATVPFIARYRKELTGGLDEVAIRDIRDTYQYILDLEARKLAVIQAVEEDGKLTDKWKLAIESAETKQVVEDLYAPFKRKRKTRASQAIEKGLEPLTDMLLASQDYVNWLEEFLQTADNVATQEEAKQGAGDILAERIANDVDIKEELRILCFSEGEIVSTVKEESKEVETKFLQYYEYTSVLKSMVAHRFLAMRRGEEQGILRLSFTFPKEKMIACLHQKWGTIAEQEWLTNTIEDSLRRLILPSLELDMRMRLKEKADEESIQVFNRNLRDMLLAPMAGSIGLLAIDPGIRTGAKWVVLSNKGKMEKYGTWYPVTKNPSIRKQSEKEIVQLLQDQSIYAVCIGNGTGSREATEFIREALGANTEIPIVSVNEAGASVYSASEIAREEFPDLDLVYRGAISIGRRFQDPLAELVKIDPKSIGVGQYQHDVNQVKLKQSLNDAIESCVNYVGVNVNTASYALLAHVSGLSSSVARNIVYYREENGLFHSRKELLKVPRLGNKAFEQAAGFLKIPESKNPLDNSAVHPENYDFVTNLASQVQLDLQELVGNEKIVKTISIPDETISTVGKLTVLDIMEELAKPGRDPRKVFDAITWQEGIHSIEDLNSGMKLEGIITNMTKFGVFVDIGVHQDGLVHISEITHKFINDPSEVCSVGDKVKVVVLEVQKERKRISLSIKATSLNTQENRRKSPKNQKQVSWQDLQKKFNSHK